MIRNLMVAVPHQTSSYKSFWESRRSSGCFACGSPIGRGWAAGPSDAPQTVSLPADWDTDSDFPGDHHTPGHIMDEFNTITAFSMTFISFNGQEKLLTVSLLWRRSLSSLFLLLFSASSSRILVWRASSLDTAWPLTLLTWKSEKIFNLQTKWHTSILETPKTERLKQHCIHGPISKTFLYKLFK